MIKYIIIAALFLAACGTALKLSLPTPSQSDADRGATSFPGLTVEDLNKGKQAYEGNCAGCHSLYSPSKFSEEKWKKEVPKMAKKANVNADTENQILKYVLTMRTATLPK